MRYLIPLIAVLAMLGGGSTFRLCPAFSKLDHLVLPGSGPQLDTCAAVG